MQVIGHGIDLVECGRIAEMVQKHGQRFLKRVFTEQERADCRGYKRQWERLAGRFAVKEAVMKILGTGWRGGIAWTDIETRNNPNGKPQVRLSGVVAEKVKEKGIREIHVSITHTAELAIASAVALGAVSS